MDESMPIWWGVIAVVLLFIFFRVFNRETTKVLAQHPDPLPNENVIPL
jgi:uncharacterized membrane protein YjfL (UPF0719 family)